MLACSLKVVTGIKLERTNKLGVREQNVKVIERKFLI